MSTVSSGRVNVTPMRAATAATLEQIRDVLSQQPPDPSLLTPGWAIFDPAADAALRGYGAVPSNLADPAIIDADGTFPRRLAARYYFWVYDGNRDKLLTKLGMSATNLDTHYLDAVDFFLSADASIPGSYLVLGSSRYQGELLPGVASLRDAMTSVDGNSDFTVSNRSSLNVGGKDFFLWLVERREHGAVVDPTITIAATTAIDTRDSRSRVNLLKDEIDEARGNFLTAVVDGDDLGPLRFMIRNPAIPAKITLTLWADGSFSVLTSDTHYSAKAKIKNENIEAVNDLAYRHLPKLIALYKADTDWDTVRRAAYRKRAKKTLRERYSPKKRKP